MLKICHLTPIPCRGAHCAPATQRAYTRYLCCTRRGGYHPPASKGLAATTPVTPVGADVPISPLPRDIQPLPNAALVGRDDLGAPSAGSTNTLHPAILTARTAVLGKRAHTVRPYKPALDIAALKKFPQRLPTPRQLSPCFQMKLREDHLRGMGPEASRCPARYQASTAGLPKRLLQRTLTIKYTVSAKSINDVFWRSRQKTS